MENATIKIDLKQVAAGVGMIFGGVMELLKAMSDENGELVIANPNISPAEGTEENVDSTGEKEASSLEASSALGHEEREAEVGLVDVRTALAKLSKKGLTKEVKELLAQHGGAKLSDIDPGNYAALLAAAKELDPDA